MKTKLLSGACLLILSTVSAEAFAQNASQSASAAGQVESERKLSTVTVTAEKRDESLLDVGASITAIGEEALAYRDLSNADDISISVPNLSYGEVAGASQITIRGIGLNVETGFAEPAVAVHLNGVYLGRANSAALGLADLASVEVLRGPQGTLYGRNATGGVVNFTTLAPTETFEAGATVGTGSFERLLGRTYLSGPLSESVQGRLFIEYEEDGGYMENRTLSKDEGGKEATTFKADLSWDVSSDVSADLFYLRVNQDWNGPTFEKLVPGALEPLAGFDPEPHSVLNNRDGRSNIDMDVAGLTVNWDAGPVVIRSITGYSEFKRGDTFDGDAMSLDIFASARTESAEAWSQEINILSDYDSQLEWLFGAFYLQEDSFARTDVDGGADAGIIMGIPGLSFTVNQLVEEVDAFGAFADLTYHVNDRFRINLGGRYSEEEKSASQTVNFSGGALALCNDFESTISFDDFTPRIGAEWDATDNTMLYARYQEGFKSGGYNQAGCGSFDPEIVESTEIGLKGEYFDGAMRVTASAFNYDYSNLQVLQIRNSIGFVENAASSSIKGLELEARVALTSRLQSELAVSLLDATYDEFLDGSGADFSENTLSRAPEYTALGALEYEVPSSSGVFGDLRLRGEVFVSDDVFYRPRNAPEDMQESYTLLNAFAALPLADGRYELRLFGKNLTDEEYKTSIIFLVDGLDGHYAPPSTWGLEFSAKW